MSVIAFDRKSNDFGDLPARFGWRHYNVHQLFRQGLDAPKGVPANIWINIIATIFCARAVLKAAWVTFANTLRWLLAVLNPDPADELLWPDLQLILDVLNASPDTLFSSTSDYARHLKQPLEGITQSSGDLFRAFRGFQVERDVIDVGASAVISMPNMLPSWTRQLFVDIILAQILHGRMHRSHRVDGVEVLIVIDEADADISTEAEEMFPDRMCPISQCFKQGREFGLSMCVAISSLRSASRFVLSNATDHFICRMTDAASILEASRTLMLPPRGELRLNCLQPGEVVVRQVGPWPHALVAQVDYMSPCRTQPDKYDTHPFVPAKRLSELPKAQEALARRTAEKRRTRLRQVQPKTKPATLSRMARMALDYASLPEYEFAPLHILFRHIGNVAPATQLAVVDELERAGLMMCVPSRIGRSNVKLKQVTEKGWSFLRKAAPSPNGRGGPEHTHFAHWVYNVAVKKGYHKCTLEPQIPGSSRYGDVGYEKDGALHIVQIIVSCESNIISHVRAAFIESRAVGVLCFVTPVKSQWDSIRARILSSPDLVFFIERIRFEVVETYMKAMWP